MEKNNIGDEKNTPIECEKIYKLKLKSFKPFISIILIVLLTLMTILSSEGSTSNSTIFATFFGIVIIAGAIYKMGIYGVIISLCSSTLFCLSVKQNLANFMINVGANVLQALVMYFFYKLFKNKLTFKDNNGYLSITNILLIVLGIIYIIVSFVDFNRLISFSIILGVAFVILIFRSIYCKSLCEIFYILFIALIPNLFGAFTGSLFYDNQFIFDNYLMDSFIWFSSNAIILSTFGFVLLYLLRNYSTKTFDEISFKLSTAIYYVSTLLWNALFYTMFVLGWLNSNMFAYFFPWIVGNIFFLMNFFTSIYIEYGIEPNKDVEEEKNKIDTIFNWFQNRAVVAESNTQMIIVVISFLLPAAATLVEEIPSEMIFVFIMNITFAVISIGLIWIPKNEIRMIATVKHIKTSCHLFTLSLLLLNAVMILVAVLNKV